MKRVVMAILMFGIASCAVEAGPVSSPAPSDDPATETTSSALEGAVAPRAVDCTDGVCESPSQCTADGGVSTGACVFRGTVCCVF